jgi:thiol-disulfide isomerase/thioredoxin
MKNKILGLGLWMLCFNLFANQIDILKNTAKQQGFFFFYSASCPHCQNFSPIIKNFSEHFGFTVIAISLDGGFLPEFPNAQIDEGQSKVFLVKVFPSLYLVNPRTQIAALITEGNINEQELQRRVLHVLQLSNKEESI